MFERLNRNSEAVLPAGVKLEDLEFVKLNKYIGKVLQVKGFFFTNSQFGKQVVVLAGDKKVNMPARAVEQFEEIAHDEAMREAVLNGGLQISDIAEVKTKNGTKTTSYKLEDVLPF